MTIVRASFATPHGVRVPSVTAEEMREVLRIATLHTGPGLLPIIENGGRSLALTALDLHARHASGRSRAPRMLVLAGADIHGAVAVCAARHLANRGADVEVVTIVPPQQSDGALGQQFLALGETPARVTRWNEAFVAVQADVVIDAVIGDRLDEQPRGPEFALVRAALHAADAGVAVLSLDVPSGVHPDSGEALGDAVRPQLTLALGLPKRGLRDAAVGALWLADLGIPPGVYARAGIVVTPFFGAADRVPLRAPRG